VKIATTATDIVDVSRMFQVMVHCQVSDSVWHFLETKNYCTLSAEKLVSSVLYIQSFCLVIANFGL
jgi:hypothetical protein